MSCETKLNDLKTKADATNHTLTRVINALNELIRLLGGTQK